MNPGVQACCSRAAFHCGRDKNKKMGTFLGTFPLLIETAIERGVIVILK
jgi:hypothetical protein